MSDTGNANQNLNHNIRVNTLHGLIQGLALSVFNPFIGIFAIKSGASNMHIALLSALPALMSMAGMIPGALFLRLFKHRQPVTAWLYLLNRLFLIAVALVPLLSTDVRAAWLVVLIGLMNLPGAVANISWQSLIAGVIPAEHRGRAFAARNRWSSLIGFIPTLIAGKLLDIMSFPVGYQLLFGLAFILSLTEIAVFLLLKEDMPHKSQAEGHMPGSVPAAPVVPHKGRLLREFALVCQEKPFLHFSLCSLLFHFGWQMGWPLFTIYQVKYLGADNTWIAMFSITSGIMSCLTYGWWGRYANRIGNMRALILATLGMAANPVFYALSTRLWMIVVFNLSMGIFTAGTVLLLFNSLLEVVPAENRTPYIAYNNMLVQLSASVAPFVGKYFADWLGIRGALAMTASFRAMGALAFAWLVYGGFSKLTSLAGCSRKQAPVPQHPPVE